MESRKVRRQKAKNDGVQFEPQYNGSSPVTYEEHYGVGNERFNNKFVEIKKAKK